MWCFFWFSSLFAKCFTILIATAWDVVQWETEAQRNLLHIKGVVPSISSLL